MRYIISYDDEPRFKVRKSHFICNKKIKYLASGIIATITAAYLFSGGFQHLQNLFFGGNADTTRRAINDMASDLRDGESIVEVIHTFCKEIIDIADIQG